jgi:AAA+ ATPase superfamily predicted ATPase
MTSWKFYGRRDELEAIKLLLTRGRWFFCAISGRRRIGKTSLIREALLETQGRTGAAGALYVQIPDSDERDVVAVFTDALAAFADANPGRLPESVVADKLRRFVDMARATGALCRAGIIVVIDEFQYFNRKALSAFTSLLQAEVDTLTGSAHGGIFVLGSIHTEMTALLEDRGSPLYARVTDRLNLDHWDFTTLFQVFADQGLDSPRDWLTFWSVFEGVPKFYRDCAYQGTFAADDHSAADRIIDTLFLSARAPLVEEAGTWFLRELRGAGVSLLRLLARQQPCAQQQLSAAYAESLGDSRSFATYLATLVDRYRLVERLSPVFAQAGSRQARYQIGDNFLAAWLAAIEPAVQAARVQPLAQALKIGAVRLENHEGPHLRAHGPQADGRSLAARGRRLPADRHGPRLLEQSPRCRASGRDRYRRRQRRRPACSLRQLQARCGEAHPGRADHLRAARRRLPRDGDRASLQGLAAGTCTLRPGFSGR